MTRFSEAEMVVLPDPPALAARAAAWLLDAALGTEGICVWDGHFYAARAVEVLGLTDRGGLLRTGVSMYNTREDLERLLTGIAKLI